MSEGILVNTADFDFALQRFARTSKRAGVEVMREQARLLFKEVAKITPPGGGKAGATLQGKAAERAGKLAIVRDLHGLYGMPGRAYSDIASRDLSAAGAFWSAYKENRHDAAAIIVKRELGKAARGFLGKKKKKEALFYISNPATLHAHIALLQSHVWHLASGWKNALQELGASIPYGVGKGDGKGTLTVEITDASILIRMTNDVRYARQIKNLPAQIRFAMKVRTGVLQRRWEDYLKRLGPKSSL